MKETYSYTVIDNIDLDMLVERINELIGEGWTPQAVSLSQTSES